MGNNILKTELINEKTIIIYEELDDNRVSVIMRYVKNRRTVDVYLSIITKEEYLDGNCVRINEDATALALFRNKNNEEVLERFFYLDNYSTVTPDFMDLAYNDTFTNSRVNEDLILIKK